MQLLELLHLLRVQRRYGLAVQDPGLTPSPIRLHEIVMAGTTGGLRGRHTSHINHTCNDAATTSTGTHEPGTA